MIIMLFEMLDKNISKKRDPRDLNEYTYEVSEQALCHGTPCDGKMYRILIQLFQAHRAPSTQLPGFLSS